MRFLERGLSCMFFAKPSNSGQTPIAAVSAWFHPLCLWSSLQWVIHPLLGERKKRKIGQTVLGNYTLAYSLEWVLSPLGVVVQSVDTGFVKIILTIWAHIMCQVHWIFMTSWYRNKACVIFFFYLQKRKQMHREFKVIIHI